MSKQFTWWRRFHTTDRLHHSQMFQGASPLLQRIEYGEYEMCPLWQQSYLEEQILEAKIKETRQRMRGRFLEETINEAIGDLQKQHYRREWQIRSHHVKQETERLGQLILELTKEFENLSSDQIMETIETNDLTTRQLYFVLRAMDQNRRIPTTKEIDRVPRLIDEQPRHLLKPKETHLQPLFNKTMKHYKIW